jgi:hypothetical protein
MTESGRGARGCFLMVPRSAMLGIAIWLTHGTARSPRDDH